MLAWDLASDIVEVMEDFMLEGGGGCRCGL